MLTAFARIISSAESAAERGKAIRLESAMIAEAHHYFKGKLFEPQRHSFLCRNFKAKGGRGVNALRISNGYRPICYHHFSGSPWRVLGGLDSGNTSTNKFTITVVNIRNDEVDRTANLAISIMLRQENNVISPRQLHK